MPMSILKRFHRSPAFHERDLLAMEPFHHCNHLRREKDDDLAQTPRMVSKDGGGNDLQVKLDVGNYAPDEVSVRILENTVTIEGKHDEQSYIHRHFIRRYTLPNDVKPESITCNLHSGKFRREYILADKTSAVKN
jgi:HSP20 family molecular chaperone IbpA